jgi:hypothetical protein
MYTICILLGTLIVGALYLITSSTMYEPPESDDDGGTELKPMPPTFTGPTGSLRYPEESTDEPETVRA